MSGLRCCKERMLQQLQWIYNQSEIMKCFNMEVYKLVIKVLFLSSGAQSGVNFPGQFLKNGWTKTNALSTACSTAWDTRHIKKWAQSVHFSRSYSKNKVPYQVPLEERNTTFRAKIEHLNITKRYIKYTYSESTLDEQFKTLILSPEVTKFQALKRGPSTGTLLHLVKIGAPILANFSKTAERNGTRPISKQSLAQAGSSKKKIIKIGSLYNELFQSKGTLPNDPKSEVTWFQSQIWLS